jgi:predicted phosphoribosyltransferase
LRAAGALLAQVLRQFDLTNALVLAIANAGAPVGREVADQLKLPLDVLIIRRLLAPSGSGSELCAVNAAGTLVLDDQMNIPADPVTPQEHFILQALSELRQRANASRGDRPPVNLTGRQILLVDCAIHTGSTMRIAIRALRKLKPARVVSAVPVAARQPYAEIATIADEAVTLAQPEPFGHAGMWYDDFNRPGDERVRDLLIAR